MMQQADFPQAPSAEWISHAETAKLIRAALKRAFPEYPARFFGVRSKSYSGGASVSVSWTDGPTAADVDSVVKRYAGGGFDGMIDMAYSSQAWLAPDGTVTFAHSSGTEASRGSVPARDGSRHHPDARLVRFGADFVFTRRDLSPEVEAWIVDYRDKHYLRASWQADYAWSELLGQIRNRLTVLADGTRVLGEGR